VATDTSDEKRRLYEKTPFAEDLLGGTMTEEEEEEEEAADAPPLVDA
jgi:hypothetical protein